MKLNPTRSSRVGAVAGFAGWLLLTAAAAVVGSVASANARSFYAQIAQPSWAPPGWLFGPVWTLLYLMMAVAAWLAWRRHGWRGASAALTLFVVQLGANALWSWLYFAWHRGALACADIAVLWVLIAWTTIRFVKLHKVAAALMLPYLAWVGYAGVLSFVTWRLNPALLGG